MTPDVFGSCHETISSTPDYYATKRDEEQGDYDTHKLFLMCSVYFSGDFYSWRGPKLTKIFQCETRLKHLLSKDNSS
ncbi:MAG: hypothetical protein Tsb0034_29520 [Ekhidna sp.]